MLENVEEFVTWGPLDKNGQPIEKQKGRIFRTFVNALKYQGYEVEWRELRACDYGAPTIRKRFFLIARCDGQPIVWPVPTHGAPDSAEVLAGKRQPWRTAAECIDWSIPVPSIFGRKKPLAENTLRRIARGLVKFVLNNPKPFIIKVNHSSDDFRGQQIDEPFQTITAKMVGDRHSAYHQVPYRSDRQCDRCASSHYYIRGRIYSAGRRCPCNGTGNCFLDAVPHRDDGRWRARPRRR